MNEILTKSSITEIKKRMFYPIKRDSISVAFMTKENKNIISILRGEEIEDWEFIPSTKNWERVR